MDAKRGYVPEDERNFCPEALETMRTASRHILYLINEGYDLKPAATFVGNHFLLSERQRLAIVRSLATKEQLADRHQKEIPLARNETRQLQPAANEIHNAPPAANEVHHALPAAVMLTGLDGKEVWVDGFNTVITLEVLLSNSLLFDCMDGTVRDLAALRGTYRIIPETEGAVRMLFDVLQAENVRKVNILLDEPVSNSGRLKSLIADIGEHYPFALNIEILRDVDRALYEKENVITSDSIILDHCKSWANVTAECMKRQARQGLRVWSEEST